MNVSPTAFEDVWVLEPQVYLDARGYFTETFREEVLQEVLQQPIRFVQDNESVSKKKELLEVYTINCIPRPKVNWYVLYTERFGTSLWI